MPKGRTNNNNQKNTLFHNEWIKQLNELKNKYKWTLSKKGICGNGNECWDDCYCDIFTVVTARNNQCAALKLKIENLKCRCGCN
jgi:hypothetical protein